MRTCEYLVGSNPCGKPTDLFFLYGNGPAPWQEAEEGEEVKEAIFYCEEHRKFATRIDVPGLGVHWYREEELFNTVPEGTFRMEIHGVPKTKEDCAALGWVASFGDWPIQAEEGSDHSPIEEQFFRLPYEQGGGHVELTKITTEAYEARLIYENGMPLEELREDGIEDQWFENKVYFTGWVYYDHYSDSMTNEWQSPIYKDDEGNFYMEAM